MGGYMSIEKMIERYKDKLEWYRDNQHIEMSPPDYWREMNYYDGLMYCSILIIDGKNDWRMVRNWKELGLDMEDDDIMSWYIDDADYYNEYLFNNEHYWVIPVRDI
jgi:hypothetical protein